MAERDVAPVSVGVLVGDKLDAVQIFVGGWHDLHDVLVRLQPGRIQLVTPAQRVEGADAFGTDLLDFAAEAVEKKKKEKLKSMIWHIVYCTRIVNLFDLRH